MKYILAKGKTNEQSESGTVDAGVIVIPVADTSGFSVGDPIFISETDGTEVEYLGPMISKTASSITISYKLQKAKGAGYKVWKPTDHVLMPYGSSSPFDGRRALGVETLRTQSATPYRTKVRDSYRTRSLTWDMLPQETWLELDAFVTTKLNDGIYNCTIGYYDSSQKKPVSVIATLLMDEIPYRERIPGLVPVTIQFQVIQEEAYQS